MILRFLVFLFILGFLIPSCSLTMEFTADAKRRKYRLRYSFIPRNPFRILYEPMQKSTLGFRNKFQSLINKQSPWSNSRQGSTQGVLVDNSQVDSRMNYGNNFDAYSPYTSEYAM